MCNCRSPLEIVKEFHGHLCPGALIGYRAALYALEELFGKSAVDEELVVIVENDSCSIDAVQALTGCTVGKGNMLIKNHGKQAFTFVNRDKNKAVRLVLQFGVFDAFEDKKATMSFLQHAPIDEIFDIAFLPDFKVPDKAQIFKTVQCEYCKEGIMESKARMKNGKVSCLNCYEEYTRGW